MSYKYCFVCGKELKKNDQTNSSSKNILLLRHKIHASIHKRAYDYLVRTQQIQNYLNWFTVMYKPIIKNTKDGEVWT